MTPKIITVMVEDCSVVTNITQMKEEKNQGGRGDVVSSHRSALTFQFLIHFWGRNERQRKAKT